MATHNRRTTVRTLSPAGYIASHRPTANCRLPTRLATLVVLAAALLLLAGCGGSGTTSAPPAATPTAIATTASNPSGGPPYPTPQEETYQGCPPQGDGGDAQLNVLKNRIDTAIWQSTPLSSLLALTWPQGVEKTRRSAWSSADAATVAQTEGRPVETEGYVLMIRHEGPESPNCHDAASRDYHVWLGVSPSDTRANSMIVELAPRVVARNPGWGGQSSLLHLAGHHVRIGGWLMLDQEHPEQLNKTRGTLWEIHPVMQVWVEQNGAWNDLASGQVALGSGRVSSGQGATTGGVSTPTHHRRRHRRHHSST